MHYCYMLFTESEPDDATIDHILAPYSEEIYFENESLYGEGNVKFPIIMWDWYVVGGRFERVIQTEDGAKSISKISDILDYDDVQTFGYIDEDLEVNCKEYFDGHKWIEDNEYLDKLENVKQRNKEADNWVTILDIHD